MKAGRGHQHDRTDSPVESVTKFPPPQVAGGSLSSLLFGFGFAPRFGTVGRRGAVAAYNDKTTLTANVTADGPNQFDFALTEKEPPK